jgi:hypothetical protein
LRRQGYALESGDFSRLLRLTAGGVLATRNPGDARRPREMCSSRRAQLEVPASARRGRDWLFGGYVLRGPKDTPSCWVPSHERHALVVDTARCLAALKCGLTLHSRGGPTARHQARATERGRLFSVARAWRPTVGLPLSSNVRKTQMRICTPSAIVFEVGGGLPALRGGKSVSSCASANSPWCLWLAPCCTMCGGSCVSQRPVSSPREIAAGRGRWRQSSGVVRREFQGMLGWCGHFVAANGIRSNRARTPNPPLKRSANGVSHWPSSARPAAHFALAAQRATPLAPA